MIDDIANSVGSAGARIPAHCIDAGSLRWTVVILGAFDLKNRLGSLASSAAAANISAGTGANHSTYGIRRQDSTLRWIYAWLYDWTRILTLVAETGESVRTVAIFLTFGPDFRLAIDIRVSDEAGWATADR